MSLNIGGLIASGPGQDARIAEARLEEVRHDEDEQDDRNDGDGGTDVDGKVGAIEGQEKSARQDDDEDAQVKESGPLCHKYPAVAVEGVAARKHFPLAGYSFGSRVSWHCIWK